jgi:hypothetical protein
MRSELNTLWRATKRWIFACEGFLLLQQLIVASSTVWLVLWVTALGEGHFQAVWLIAYLASLLLPYAPGGIALYYNTRVQTATVNGYVTQMAGAYAGQLSAWTHKTQRSGISSLLGGEVSRTLMGFADYTYSVSSAGLNVLLNLVVLATVVEPWLAVSYCLGIGLALAVYHAQKRRRETLAQKAQHSRTRWTGMLLRLWDNILLNNSYNRQLWISAFGHRAKCLTARLSSQRAFGTFVSIAMALSLIGPSLLLVAVMAILKSQDLVWLLALAVTLPRLFQMLVLSYELLSLVTEWPTHRAQLSTVVGALSTRQLASPELMIDELKSRVNWPLISAQATPGDLSMDPSALFHALPEKGRVTLQGENGSGKSSLLLLLKALHGEQAFYLPAHHDLLFARAPKRGSTGQTSTAILHELIERVRTPILLLDEWDANLDSSRRERLSQLLDGVASRALVIEVRHGLPPSL